jgi:hypothetical protein
MILFQAVSALAPQVLDVVVRAMRPGQVVKMQRRHREHVEAKLAMLSPGPAGDDWVEQALALFERMTREQKRRFAGEIVAGKLKREA